MEKRVRGVKITPHNCKIQDKDEEFYMQFTLVICGLDSIEARRWINSTLVGMVDWDVQDSFKILIDGGTEGTSKRRGSWVVLTSSRIQGPVQSNMSNHDLLHRVPA